MTTCPILSMNEKYLVGEGVESKLLTFAYFATNCIPYKSTISCFLDLIRFINDPEHPLTLEELHVVQQNLIKVDNEHNEVFVNFTPTIPHCSMATLIGLSIRVKLLRSLPPRFKVTVEITPGTHSSEIAVNKQLADKERVAAALENSNLITVINQCIAV